MSLSEKSDEELTELLAEYGIKHGPIVDSTRELYEKKLIKAMKDAPVKPSSDKTYYREEEEEITYITYQSPVQQEVYGDTLKRRGNVEPEEEEDEESEPETQPPPRIVKKTANHSTARPREPVRKSGSSVWKAIRLLLLLAVLAAVLFYAYSRVINDEENPSGIQ